jgi:hypothetical protein
MKKICILGSGVSGSILASELSLKSHVVVIDCDSLSKAFNPSFDLDKSVDPDLKKEKFVGYGFGGTTNLWHGVLTKLDGEDMQFIDRLAQTCISCEFEKYTDKLEKYFGKLSFLRQEKLGFNKLSSFISLKSLNFKRYVHMVRPARFRKIISFLKRKGRIDTMEGAVAISLHIDNTSNYINYVEVIQNGQKIRISADIFIVAMGGLESPRILLQSFKGSDHYNPIIGKGLMDHPHVSIGTLTIPKYIFYTQHGTRSPLFSNSSRVGYTIPDKYRRVKELNHSIYIRPLLSKDVDLVKSGVKTLVSNQLSFRFFLKMFATPSLFVSAFILLSERFGFGVYTNTFDVHMHLEQNHKGCSSVSLTPKKDEYGRMIPKIYRDFSSDLFRDIVHTQNFLKNIVICPGVFNSATLEKNKLESGAHFSGACRLGSEQSNSVVDKNLKYHSLENLFICDASIIPKIGNSNLSLTIACFALRLSNYLCRKYNDKC